MENNYFDNTAWLQARLGRFTASEIHLLFKGGRKKEDIFGESALTYIRTKAAEILTQEVKDEINAKAMEWGKNNEAFACAAFEKQMGVTGTYYGGATPTFFPYGDFEGCSPDWENDEAGADFKCPFNSAEHVKNLLLQSAEDLKNERFEYYSQLQKSMLKRGWGAAYFVSYDPRMAFESLQLKVITVYPDQEWIDEYNKRIPLAIELLKETLNSVMNSVLIATYDEEAGATIIE